MRRITLVLIGFVLGTFIPTSHAQNYPPNGQIYPLGMSHLAFVQMMFQQEERNRLREQVEKEFDARMEAKQRAEKLKRLYEDVRDVWQAAVDEQQKQINQQAEGITDIRQEVLLEKLTGEMAKKAAEIAKLNKVKR